MTGSLAQSEELAERPAAAPAHRRRTARLRGVPWQTLWPALVAFVASRAVVAATLYAAPVLHPGYSRQSFFSDWDAKFYLDIARHGYPQLRPKSGGFNAEAAFFPLLPLAVRAFHEVTRLSYLASGAVVANASTLAAFCAIWLLARDVLGRERGAWSVAFVAFWPATFALSMVYSDGFMLFFAAWSLLAMRRRQWVVAFVTAYLAGLSRPDAIVLAASAAWLGIAALRRPPVPPDPDGADPPPSGRDRWLPWLAAVGAPAGFGSYLVYTWAALGNPTAWFTAEKQGWGNSFDFGRTWLRNARTALHHPTQRFDLAVLTVAGIIGLALLIWMLVERLPVPLTIYAAGVVLLGIGSGDGNSIPRYCLDAFPLFLAPAARLKPAINGAIVGMSGAGLAVFLLAVDVFHKAIP